LNRRYRQLVSEFEEYRSQPKVSYSEYEVRYAHVCVFFVYYLILFCLNCQEKRSLQEQVLFT
jgi:hypothetical protein